MTLLWLALAASLVSLSLGAAAAESAFDKCVRKLCVSTAQEDCWVKAGTSLCDRADKNCKGLPDHAPSKILGRDAKRWKVKTADGSGWVSDRMMMVDSSKCPGL